jgi:uncharacterized membrane protein
MKYSCSTGQVINYTAPIAVNNVKNNPYDADNFYPADGEAYGNDMVGDEGGPFDYAVGDPFFSEATGCRPGYTQNYFGHCIKTKSGSSFNGDQMSYAGGLFSKKDREKRRQQREGRRSKNQERFKSGQESRAEARKLRAQAKLEAAKGQRAAGESLGKESQSDIELSKALAPSTLTSGKKETSGMSTTTKILIGVGAVAVLGLVVYLSTRNTGKNTK